MLFGFSSDAQLLLVLNCSSELRDYCMFSKVPDASVITRFEQDYCDQIAQLFESLVELTEPICRSINEKKADYLIYDTTGVEPYVTENNPKFINSKSFRGSAKGKIAQCVLNGSVISLYNREILVFVAVTPHALLLLMADVFTLIRIKSFGFIPVSPELRSIGIISMDIVS